MNNDHSNLSSSPSPPRPLSLGLQSPRLPLGPPAAPSLFQPPSGRFLEPFQQPTTQPRPPPPVKPKGFISISPASSGPPLSPNDYFLLGPSARPVSRAPPPPTLTAPPLSPLAFTPLNNLYGS